MIILAVDYGDVRTGLAVCDRQEILASPVGTLTQPDAQKLAEAITTVAAERGAQLLVVGEAVNMDGSRGERAQKCAAFAQLLAQTSGLPCQLYDERCTTVMAHAALNVTNTRGKKTQKRGGRAFRRDDIGKFYDPPAQHRRFPCGLVIPRGGSVRARAPA